MIDRATRRRRQAAIRKIEKRPGSAMTAVADASIPNLFESAIHQNRIRCPLSLGLQHLQPCPVCGTEGMVDVGCGAPGEIDRYWCIAICSSCGVVPSAEMTA